MSGRGGHPPRGCAQRSWLRRLRRIVKVIIEVEPMDAGIGCVGSFGGCDWRSANIQLPADGAQGAML